MAIFFHTETKFHVEHKRILKNWIKQVVLQHRFKLGDINIILVNDEKLYELNTEVLNHDTYTDIITFNYNEKNILSGDLFISIDRVRENAGKFAVPETEEFYRVIIHGVLHLLGFDDKTKQKKTIMRQKEDESLGILHAMFHVKHD